MTHNTIGHHSYMWVHNVIHELLSWNPVIGSSRSWNLSLGWDCDQLLANCPDITQSMDKGDEKAQKIMRIRKEGEEVHLKWLWKEKRKKMATLLGILNCFYVQMGILDLKWSFFFHVMWKKKDHILCLNSRARLPRIVADEKEWSG